MDINIKTFADLKSYIDQLTPGQLAQPVTVVVEEGPVQFIRGAEILPQDILQREGDPYDSGTADELREEHGAGFDPSAYEVSFATGTAFLVLGLTDPGLPIRTCRICGCTDEDCSACIEKTGIPCHWVEKDLCSACMPGQATNLLLPGRDF